MVQVDAVVQVGLLVVSVIGLWIGARLLVDAAVRLARRLGLAELTIGLTIVAAGTSAPELVVTADAAVAGLGDIAVGNIVGSNIYNIAFILGVVSLVRFIPIERSLVHRDGIALLASIAVGAVALLDLTVSRLEGAVLVTMLVAYTGYLLRTGTTSAADATGTPTVSAPTRPADRPAAPGGDAAAVTASQPAISTALTEQVSFRGRDAVLLIAGLAVVVLSGDLLVQSASTLARTAGVSDRVIGGTIVAAGTSTPEFAVSLLAVSRGRLGVSVGNVVGSCVFNTLGILGVGALVRPLSFSPGILETVAWLVVVATVLIVALWSGRKLSRAEGAVFTGSELLRWALGLIGVLG
jgi:cation:H+ antiporter